MRTAIYGSRPDGHAKVVVDVLAEPLGIELVGLIDDWPENAERRVGPLAVIGTGTDLSRLAAEGAIEAIVLGFGAAEGRGRALQAIAAAGLALPTLIHPSAYVAPSAELGEGVQILPTASVGAGARLARGTLVNSGAVVEHDAELGEGAVVDPGAVLTGRVRVGAETEIGAGAVLIPDVVVGSGVTVGAGAVVTAAVADGETVVGVPARPLSRG